jgi:hypothetical protein
VVTLYAGQGGGGGGGGGEVGVAMGGGRDRGSSAGKCLSQFQSVCCVKALVLSPLHMMYANINYLCPLPPLFRPICVFSGQPSQGVQGQPWQGRTHRSPD